jgi:hypothetical protein
MWLFAPVASIVRRVDGLVVPIPTLPASGLRSKGMAAFETSFNFGLP